MTFQPPPPPPGGTPPAGPPPAQWGPPPGGSSGGSSSFDPKSINPLDWAVLGLGFLMLIFSFFSFYSASASGPGIPSQSESYSAWHDIFGGGFFGWIGMIFVVAGAAALAIGLFAPQISLPLPARLLALIGFAAGAVCEILATFIHPKFATVNENIGGQHFSASFGHGFSFWISLIFAIAGTVLALMRFQATGGKLPGALGDKVPNIGGYGPQGGITGGTNQAPGFGNQPPPAGYGTPPPPGYGTPAPPQPGPQPGPGYGNQPPPPPPGYGPPR